MTRTERSEKQSAWQRKNGAFYTPATTARRMARLLRLKGPATVVDPACGRGDLLSAVAECYDTSKIKFVGIDIDPRGLEACENKMAAQGVSADLRKGDFLSDDVLDEVAHSGRIYVVMNPPFKGYVALPRKTRDRLRRDIPSLRGRFNLAHAFLTRILTDLQPESVVALLPGSWPHATYNHLRSMINLGANSWRFLPESLFDGATTTAGILTLRRFDRRHDGDTYDGPGGYAGPAVRQGVATGADYVFLRAASLRPRSGRVVPAARGRDVSKGSRTVDLPRIWIPPAKKTEALVDTIGRLSDADRKRLSRRYCVNAHRLPQWSYHETIPAWFLGAAKLIVPEVCTRMSILEDPGGKVLPLHSTIAIQVADADQGRNLSKFLGSDGTWQELRANSPRMVNGAIRLTVPVLRRALAGKGWT